MHLSFVGRLSLGLAAISFVILEVDQAHACARSPDPLVQLSSKRVPADGLLAGHFRRPDCEFSVVDEDGQTLTGEFLVGSQVPVGKPIPEGRAFFVWKPEVPWSEGKTYRVPGCYDTYDDAAFVIAPPDQPAPTIVEYFSRLERGDGFVRCAEYSEEYGESLIGSCMDYSGFFERTVYEASLGLGIEGDAAGQYRYEITWSSPEEELTERTDEVVLLGHSFRGAPPEVCYELTAVAVDPARDGFHVPRTCFSTAELDPLETLEEPWGGMNYVLATCVKPPPAYRDEWCKLFSSSIEAQKCEGFDVEPCEAALVACSSSSEDTAGSSNGNDSSGGCAFAGAPLSAGGLGAWLALFGALGGWALRRGRSRPE